MLTDTKKNTLTEMAQELNDNGFRTHRDKEFTPRRASGINFIKKQGGFLS